MWPEVFQKCRALRNEAEAQLQAEYRHAVSDYRNSKAYFEAMVKREQSEVKKKEKIARDLEARVLDYQTHFPIDTQVAPKVASLR